MEKHRERRIVSKDTVQQILNLYQNNHSIKCIAHIVSVGRDTITRILKRNNFYDPIRSRYKIDQVKLKRNEKIIILTHKGYSIRQISEKLHISHSTVSRIRFKYKGSQDIIRNDCRAQCLFNENFFEIIDTEEKAYWLGFLYADGCITKGKEVRIHLALQDRMHIEKFKLALQYPSARIQYPADGRSLSISANSKKMVEDLTKLGCYENKTWILTFPTVKQVPRKLIKHFIRGYFDGDGCISIANKKRYADCIIKVVGTCNFCKKYQQIVDQAIHKIMHSKIEIRNDIATVTWHGVKQCIKIYHYLYDDATVFLTRKKETFNTLIGRLERKSYIVQDNNSGIKRESRKVQK